MYLLLYSCRRPTESKVPGTEALSMSRGNPFQNRCSIIVNTLSRLTALPRRPRDGATARRFGSDSCRIMSAGRRNKTLPHGSPGRCIRRRGPASERRLIGRCIRNSTASLAAKSCLSQPPASSDATPSDRSYIRCPRDGLWPSNTRASWSASFDDRCRTKGDPTPTSSPKYLYHQETVFETSSGPRSRPSSMPPERNTCLSISTRIRSESRLIFKANCSEQTMQAEC